MLEKSSNDLAICLKELTIEIEILPGPYDALEGIEENM